MTGCLMLDNVVTVARKNGKRLPCERLQAENAKLREHVSEVWAIANTAMRGNPIPSAWGDEVERVSRELGIEVPE